MEDISEKIAKSFFSSVEKKIESDNQSRLSNKRVIEEKNEILIPIKKFLKRLIDAGVYVTNSSLYTQENTKNPKPPQKFQVWEEESSPSWRPGNSLFFDHPGIIEIAVPNKHKRKDDGLIIISCVSEHPDAHLLKGPFYTDEEALKALASFLIKNTVKIERKY